MSPNILWIRAVNRIKLHTQLHLAQTWCGDGFAWVALRFIRGCDCPQPVLSLWIPDSSPSKPCLPPSPPLRGALWVDCPASPLASVPHLLCSLLYVSASCLQRCQATGLDRPHLQSSKSLFTLLPSPGRQWEAGCWRASVCSLNPPK